MNELTKSMSAHWPSTHFIDGRWTAADGRSFPDRNPFDGEIVAEIAAGGRAETEARTGLLLKAAKSSVNLRV